jgi:hypothetical protein
MAGFAEDYVDVAERLRDALSRLPIGKRGPRSHILQESLLNDLGEDACWPWRGRIGRTGYGIATLPGSRTLGTSAHRVVWCLLHGQVPDGWHIDHLCHTDSCRRTTECPHRRCVNPRHLAATTARQNVLRGQGPSAVNAAKTVCVRGHFFTEENTYVAPDGHRTCRTCYRMHDANRRHALRMESV